MKISSVSAASIVLLGAESAWSFQYVASSSRPRADTSCAAISRRNILSSAGEAAMAAGAAILLGGAEQANADAAAIQDTLNIDSFLRSGVDAGGPMGVSSQAGKSRPQTGVVLRDGSEILQDGRSGAVSAEILTGTKANPMAVLVSFASPWKLETGPVFDVETRDGKTGNGAFLAVTKSTEGKALADLPSSFFLERLFDPTGRFSFYGPPTDVKVKKNEIVGDRRYIELSFSNLSQSTNAEIPRRALLVATIPSGSENAVTLVASANSGQWKKGADKQVQEVVDSFRAVPAPKSSLKLRAKDRGAPSLDF